MNREVSVLQIRGIDVLRSVNSFKSMTLEKSTLLANENGVMYSVNLFRRPQLEFEFENTGILMLFIVSKISDCMNIKEK